FARFLPEAADLVVRYGGSLSGEHGDGQARGALLERMFGPRILEAFRRFKTIWDPDWRMNPGKVIDADPPDAHLRLQWRPSDPPTHYGYRREGGSFQGVALRCVGVGKCRRHGGGTMCPSYMVTGEEQHSTRGRARLLYEMLEGDVIRDGWKSEAVKEALDLCLACKGCRGDCPVGVDMATYKSEFAAHYYEGRMRPRHAWAMGRIRTWARLGAPVAPLANWVLRTRPLAAVLKRVGGIAPARDLPPLSHPDFHRTELARRLRGDGPRDPGAAPHGRVIFWPDTFNAYFHAETAVAGVEALQGLGFQVELPDRPLCCGRPLYDFGWIDRARALWRETLEVLDEPIRSGVPIVGIEPSCVAAFRDELPNLFPDDPRAQRLAGQTYLLSELVQERLPDPVLPASPGPVLLHGHCHQKAVLDFDADRAVLERMGARVQVPDSGCCGMAGPFGFEAGHYDVAQACGERVLLPAVRDRADGVRVVTEGFSCREMIAQNTGVRALNLAEVLRDALADAREAAVPRTPAETRSTS
ncbi:MAG: 4Fe-4S dicluster domain-containing protein, partial [Gemmatimonadetes bacterium]|nr:4Fe-4S dicluster domain-containing protein [Gemmatimonadota bacterium]